MSTLSVEVMMMRDDKSVPSRKMVVNQPWFWPVIYGLIALFMVGFILFYNFLLKPDEQAGDVLQPVTYEEVQPTPSEISANETLKYPFDESYVKNAQILQDYYDLGAEASQRENALLVFNQTFSTSTGISIGINEEPFQVLAAMTGEVTEIQVDAFTGNMVELTHSNGLVTRYQSVADFVVEKGDVVMQGDPIATTIANEWNPSAGVHLHFEVLKDGKPVNPRSYLSF